MSSKIETSKRIWKRVFSFLFQIHSGTFRESNLITVTTDPSVVHVTLHENIPVLMEICSTQSMWTGEEERNKVNVIKLLITGQGEHGFYITIAHKRSQKM
jgi:hypothetical protein